jgi:hypothetical protein
VHASGVSSFSVFKAAKPVTIVILDKSASADAIQNLF